MVALLAFFGRAIANVPYLREVYYDQVIAALSITNTELGILSSAVGIASILGYFFGGFLADRFSSKKIIMISGAAGAAGAAGALIAIWYAMFPPFPVLVFIHAAIALDGTLLFWAACVRMLRLLGGKEGQGKYYGFAEGLRATIGIVLPMVCTAIMARSVMVSAGLRNALLFYAGCYFATAVLAFFVLQDVKDEGADTERQKFDPRECIALFKLPGVWLVSLLIFGTYTVFSLQSYSTPYMTGICGFSPEFASTVATFRQYGVGLAAMPLFGIFADDIIKSPAKACLIGAVLLIPCALGMMLCPPASGLLVVVIVLAIGFLAQGVRGVYYATQNEARIPVGSAGAAAGIISSIGFLPDAFIFAQVGGWLDAYPPEQAYGMIWVYMIVGAVIAAASALGILLIARGHELELSAEVSTSE